jgi:uncharacterized integral membrane protein
VAESPEREQGWNELPKQGRKVSPELVIAGLIALLLVVFVVQNADDTKVTWIVKDSTTPLWVVIVVSAVGGYLIGQLIEAGVKRRRRNRRRD